MRARDAFRCARGLVESLRPPLPPTRTERRPAPPSFGYPRESLGSLEVPFLGDLECALTARHDADVDAESLAERGIVGRGDSRRRGLAMGSDDHLAMKPLRCLRT